MIQSKKIKLNTLSLTGHNMQANSLVNNTLASRSGIKSMGWMLSGKKSKAISRSSNWNVARSNAIKIQINYFKLQFIDHLKRKVS